ncbi:unnamed protein product [Hydatigera taeniaeformis]|uniref:Uncharacterized protein n=1 Tax=Hydatigena taeniaeformis TaxID=6205 RepID=A0A0R3WYY0_HYDTA|nr:unnamed protein product [Hydatigera taeniaeformis]
MVIINWSREEWRQGRGSGVGSGCGEAIVGGKEVWSKGGLNSTGVQQNSCLTTTTSRVNIVLYSDNRVNHQRIARSSGRSDNRFLHSPPNHIPAQPLEYVSAVRMIVITIYCMPNSPIHRCSSQRRLGAEAEFLCILHEEIYAASLPPLHIVHNRNCKCMLRRQEAQ